MLGHDLLVIGYAGDPTTEHVLGCLEGFDFHFLELFEYYKTGNVQIDPQTRELLIQCGDMRCNLGEYRAIFQRLLAPPTNGTAVNSTRIEQARFRALDIALQSCSARVVNKPYAGWENNFKPLQTHLLREAGFRVPESISTSIAEDLVSFSARFPVIYKSNSGERSIVDVLEDITPQRLLSLSHCPVFFQQQILGIDVRVHSVGARTFGVSIESDIVDYRYASRRGLSSTLRPFNKIPDYVSRLCISYAASRGIHLAGFDFKVDESGEWYCLEMNPCPGFDSYDRVLGGAIGSAVIASLI